MAGNATPMAMASASNAVVYALERRVGKALTQHHLSGKRLLIAVSGGPDSMALLHALQRLRDDFGLKLHGAHVNHKLRGAESDADAEFVARAFREMGVPFTLDSANVAAYRRKHRLSLEDAARRVRYAFLANASEEHKADAVALGHTTDDQAETVLMHIIRGSGLEGLRGMQTLDERCIGNKPVALFRPILGVSRAETQAYCDALGLKPRIDVSNSSPEFLRNRIRLQLVPRLEQINPSVQDALVRLAQNATQDSNYIRAQADAVWNDVARLEHAANGDVISLDTVALSGEHPAIQSYALRRGVEAAGGEAFQRHVLDMMGLLARTPDKTLDLPGGLVFATDYGRALIGSREAVEGMLSPLPALNGEAAIAVPGETQVGVWQVSSSVENVEAGPIVQDIARGDRQSATGEGQQGIRASETLDLDCVGDRLLIRARQRGDRFQPLGMEGSKSLREFMIDAGIPQRWRDGLPLVVSERGIVCVPGWRIAHWARVTDATRRVLRLSITYGISQ